VAQTHSIGPAHNIERSPQRPLDAVSPSVPVNDDAEGGGRCPACRGPASIAPTASTYRGQGIIHHHWLCRACGHNWITVLHVSV
jgi:hypothetical protein